MADVINLPYTGQGSMNVGTGAGAFNPDLVDGVLLIPSAREFNISTETDTVSDFVTALTNGCKTATKGARFYPLKSPINFKQSNSQGKKATTDLGQDYMTNSGIPRFDMAFFANAGENSFDFYKNLLRFKNQQSRYSPLFWDKLGKVWGTNATPSNGYKMKGFTPFQLFSDSWEAPEPGKLPNYPFTIQLDKAVEWNENLLYIDTGIIDLGSVLTPVTDIYIVAVPNGTSNHVNLYFFDGFSNEDLTDTYGAALASTSLITATKNSDGSSMTVSAATYVPAANGAKGYVNATITTGTGVAATFGLTSITTLIAAGITNSATNYEWNQTAYRIGNTANSCTIS